MKVTVPAAVSATVVSATPGTALKAPPSQYSHASAGGGSPAPPASAAGRAVSVTVAPGLPKASSAATLSAAAGSAQAVSGDAIGVIGQFFAQAILGACGDVVQGITKVASSVDDVRKGIEAVAKEYQDIDTANANTFAGRL